MDITALFDDVDAAEHALINLQALGIFPSRYKIRALHISENTERGGAFAGTNVIGGNASGGWANGGFPGFAAFGAAGGDTAFGGGEPPNREVQMLLTVEDGAAYRARSALISNRARRVRIV